MTTVTLTPSGGVAKFGTPSVVVTFGNRMAIALFEAEEGEVPVPDDDPAPTTPTLDWEFGTAQLDADGSTAEFDPYEPVHSESFRGLEVLTDGFGRNMEFDGDRVTYLEIIAPKTAPTVGVDTPAGSGITGTFKYKYRYKNSKTGKVSGFSPISDAVSPAAQEVNVTAMEVSGDGQVDYIQVFRTLSGFYDAYYYVAEVANTGSPAYADENTDADIGVETVERDDLVQGRTFTEGIMWPVLKSKQHLGAMYYFGLLRMPTYSVGTVSGTAGNNYVEMDTGTGCLVRENRRGQKLKITGNDTDFQIIDIDAANSKIYIYPVLPSGFSPSNATYTIEDNRDGRLVSIYEFGWNASVPTNHEITLGSDISDIVVDMFTLNGTTYFASLYNIFQITGDKTVAPWETAELDAVVDEGPCGPNAGVVVPGIGYIYLDRKLGPRVFRSTDNGGASVYLGSDIEETTILDEWRRFRDSRKWYATVRYSRDKNLVLFSYSRDAESGKRHIMVFSLATGEWLGPWTHRMTEYSTLHHSSYYPVEVFGDDLGSIYQDYKGARDGFSDGTLAGTLTSASGRVFTDNTASFLSTGEGLYSSIVEFESPDGSNVSYAYVISNTGTTLTTLSRPSPYPSSGWTYRIAPIPWVCKTGYIDGGNPHQHKEFFNVQARWERGSSGSVRCAVGKDGDSLYEVQSGEESIADTVHGRFQVDKKGLVFQLQMDGSGPADEPKITQVVAFIEKWRSEDA